MYEMTASLHTALFTTRDIQLRKIFIGRVYELTQANKINFFYGYGHLERPPNSFKKLKKIKLCLLSEQANKINFRFTDEATYFMQISSSFSLHFFLFYFFLSFYLRTTCYLGKVVRASD